MIPVYGLSGTEGVYSTPTATPAKATTTGAERVVLLPGNNPDERKAQVLIALKNTDRDAWRLATLYMPYVVDIDPTDGGFIFPSQELAGIAAAGEDEFVAYCANPAASELGKIKLFSKIGKALSNAGKAVVNAGKAAVQSVANVAKSGANVLKATGQLVTGNAKGAGKTMKKAGEQLVSAAVDPVKTAVKDTVTIAKDSFDILKETVKIAGKVFKVLFIKINPVTVLIRNSWRGLMAINFLGMATRLAVGLMTWGEAEKAGYSYDVYNKAVKAIERAKKMYKKMGGNADKLVKSIRNGAKRKPLFSKDIRPNSKLNFANSNTDDGETTLGEAVTVATMVAACVGILTSVWAWVKDIVQTAKANKENKAAQQQAEEQRKYNAEHYEIDANGNVIVDQYGRPVPKGQIDADIKAAQAAAQAAQQQPAQKGSDTNNIIKYVAIGGAVVLAGALLMSGGKGGKRRNRR
jgi:hypothetical protein